MDSEWEFFDLEREREKGPFVILIVCLCAFLPTCNLLVLSQSKNDEIPNRTAYQRGGDIS